MNAVYMNLVSSCYRNLSFVPSKVGLLTGVMARIYNG